MTNFFFNNKLFPFNLDLFSKYSDYFLFERQKICNNDCYPLILEIDDHQEISEDSID